MALGTCKPCGAPLQGLLGQVPERCAVCGSTIPLDAPQRARLEKEARGLTGFDPRAVDLDKTLAETGVGRFLAVPLAALGVGLVGVVVLAAVRMKTSGAMGRMSDILRQSLVGWALVLGLFAVILPLALLAHRRRRQQRLLPFLALSPAASGTPPRCRNCGGELSTAAHGIVPCPRCTARNVVDDRVRQDAAARLQWEMTASWDDVRGPLQAEYKPPRASLPAWGIGSALVGVGVPLLMHLLHGAQQQPVDHCRELVERYLGVRLAANAPLIKSCRDLSFVVKDDEELARRLGLLEDGRSGGPAGQAPLPWEGRGAVEVDPAAEAKLAELLRTTLGGPATPVPALFQILRGGMTKDEVARQFSACEALESCRDTQALCCAGRPEATPCWPSCNAIEFEFRDGRLVKARISFLSGATSEVAQRLLIATRGPARAETADWFAVAKDLESLAHPSLLAPTLVWDGTPRIRCAIVGDMSVRVECECEWPAEPPPTLPGNAVSPRPDGT